MLNGLDLLRKLNGLDLFSGIGGITLALREWIQPIAYCEIDPYCQSVLLSRISDGSLPNSPIWDNIKTLSYDRRNWPEIDIVYGGFPCQDISIAGSGKGLAGERSGLFYEIVRLINEIRPKFLFLENVPAITTRGGLEVVKEITKMGYDCRWITITASSVGALHKRERWFLLAHSTSKGADRHAERKKKEYALSSYNGFIGNSNCQPSEQANKITESKQAERETWRGSARQYWPFESREHWQEIVNTVCRVSDGISFHVDRLRALGNSVVPQQVKEAFKILMGLK